MSIFSASQTRSHVARNHAVFAPESHVPARIAGWRNAETVTLIGPRLGAKFAEYLITLNAGGLSAMPRANTSRFVYILDGGVTFHSADQSRALNQGGFAYIPPDTAHEVRCADMARIVVIEKPYVATSAAQQPDAVVIGREQDIPRKPVGGDPSVQVKQLLPDDAGFDMAMNIMAFEPGAALGLVEVHVMEHGLLMLDGSLLYRLGERYSPVQAGDVIYMAPFCPQWCAAFGRGMARYLLYKDWNRDAFE